MIFLNERFVFDESYVGLRVECIRDNPDDNDDIVVGSQGTICCVDSEQQIGVCWDEKVCGGHNCGRHCEFGHGWYVRSHDIRVISELKDLEIDEDAFAELFSGIIVHA